MTKTGKGTWINSACSGQCKYLCFYLAGVIFYINQFKRQWIMSSLPLKILFAKQTTGKNRIKSVQKFVN